MKKMVMAVVPMNEAEQVLSELINEGYTATFTESWGGMLRQSQLSLFIAVEEDKLNKVLKIIHDNCREEIKIENNSVKDDFSSERMPVTTGLGGAVIFVWNMEKMDIY